MIQVGERQRLFPEAPPYSFVAKSSRGQDLQGNIPVESLVVGTIDYTHAAGANFLHDSVTAELLANHDRGNLTVGADSSLCLQASQCSSRVLNRFGEGSEVRSRMPGSADRDSRLF